MSASNHYDVIIIGTGAGGGTLLHRLAPTGKRILVLERGDFVPREKDNWDSRAVNVEAKYNAKETWFDKAGKALHPHTNYYVGGNTKFYGAALFRLPQGGLRRAASPRRRFAGLAHLVRRPGALLHAGRAALSRSRNARRGSDRAARQRSLSAPGGQPRAAHPAAGRRLRSPGHEAVPRSPRHPAEREGARPEPLHPLRDLRRLSLPGGRQGGRPHHLRRALPWSFRTSPCSRTPTCRAWRRPPRAARSRRSTSERNGAEGDLYGRSRGRLRRRHQLRRPPAPIGERQAPARPRQLLRRGGPALHGPRQLGAPGRFQVPEPHGLPEDPGPERLLLRLEGLGVPDGAHLLRGQAGRRRPVRGGPGHRARLHAGPDGQALPGLLADLRGPARSRTTA